MIWTRAFGARRSAKISAGRDLVAVRRQAGFLGALDLRDPAIVDDQLHDAEAQRLDFLAHELDPVGRGSQGGSFSFSAHDKRN